MITALSVLDVIVSIALIGSVLMQSGKGSGLSDAFGAVAVILAKAMIWIQ